MWIAVIFGLMFGRLRPTTRNGFGMVSKSIVRSASGVASVVTRDPALSGSLDISGFYIRITSGLSRVVVSSVV